jgi:toxin ParE1/3/4
LKVIWTREAERDLDEAIEYIAERNPRAAAWMEELVVTAAAKLSEFPNRGKSGLIMGTREIFPHQSYRLVYEVRKGEVWIVAVVHTARRWPPAGESDQ